VEQVPTTEYRRATDREIELAKRWVLANTSVHTEGFDPTDDPEYAKALELIIFTAGGRYEPPKLDRLQTAAAVLHYAEGTIAPVAFHPDGCGTCTRAVELVDRVDRTYTT
jgi:hypothetical protein